MESRVTLPGTGAVTTMSVAAPDGLILYNDHDSASVTISSSGSVFPGGGIVIKPKGTVRWTSPGEPIYGVTGAGFDVPILLTDDVGELASPLDVAVATAQRLSAQGIPNVGLTEELFRGSVPFSNDGNMVGGVYRVPVRLLGYASVIVQITTEPETTLGVMMGMGNPTTIMTSSKQLSMMGTTIRLQMPVTGEYLIFSQSVNIILLGTNRDLPFEILDRETYAKFSLLNYTTTGVQFAWLSYVGAQNNVMTPFTHGGGMITFRTYLKGDVSGIFQCYTPQGNFDIISSREMSAGDAAGTFGVGVVGMAIPAGSIAFRFRTGAAGGTSATYTCDISVIPER